MKFIIRLVLLAAMAGTFFVMFQTGGSATYLGGAAVILVLIWLFRKTVKPRARNRSAGGGYYGGSGGGSPAPLPDYSEVMQIINDYVGYYAHNFDCRITPNHIYIRISFDCDTSAPLIDQRVSDLCNELSGLYGVSVSVN